jgi:molybdopterin-synthase adenylyltransferase
MLARIFTNSRERRLRSKEVRCLDLRGKYPDVDGVAARHAGVAGFDPAHYARQTITLIGGGGLAAEYGEGFTRKGIGNLIVFDGDRVEVSNLNRQFFGAKDIGRNKAVALAENLARHGFMGTRLVGFPYYFQTWLERRPAPKTDLIVCGVDNEETRLFVARYARQHTLPAIFIAVSRDANQGYVFIQEVGGPCYACLFPDARAGTQPCPGVPAMKDVLKVVGGLTLFAADTVLLRRRRSWNYRMVYLSGFVPDACQHVTRNPKCPVCGLEECYA